MNQQDIEQVVKAVLLKMQSSDTPPAAVHEMGVFASLDDAVAAAKVAQQGLKSVAMRQLAIAAIREAGEKHARDLAELAVSETGMGRVEDKFAKNVAQARGTPGVECLSPQVLTGDNGLTLIENAPWGVVASVTPSTNPAATVINNAISLIAAGNSVIFAPHPAAKKVSQRAITLLNLAIVAAGGPENLLVTVTNPDIETAQRLFKFPGIGLLVVTGGEAVVEAARKHTNKRLIAAGAGNPPVVVDETADLARAAQSIVKGASFDNNIICADEKVLIVVDSVADELMRLMEGQHAVKLTAEQAQQLQSVLLKNIDERGKGTVSRDWVGRDAAKIAAAIGLKVPEQTRLLFVETTAEHPFAVTELMMPVLPVVRVANVADAIALAVKLEGGCHHTAAMHSRNIENYLALGVLAGIVTIPIGCIAGGLVAMYSGVQINGQPVEFTFALILMNMIPVLIVAVLVALGLKFIPEKMINGFQIFAKFLVALITLGLAAAVVKFLLGWELIPGLDPIFMAPGDKPGEVMRAIEVIGSISCVLLGAYPMVLLLTRWFEKPLMSVGKVLNMNNIAAAGMVATLANNIPMFGMMKQMDTRGKVINCAFAVSAAFALGDHLGFAAANMNAMIFPMIVGKLIGGVTAIGVAMMLVPKEDASAAKTEAEAQS